jgi:hypothetical protein
MGKAQHMVIVLVPLVPLFQQSRRQTTGAISVNGGQELSRIVLGRRHELNGSLHAVLSANLKPRWASSCSQTSPVSVAKCSFTPAFTSSVYHESKQTNGLLRISLRMVDVVPARMAE